MGEETKIDPKHAGTRLVLRTLGPGLLLVGLVLVVVGMVSFFSSFGTHEPPRYFWCIFLGIPLLFGGAALSMFGFMGAYFRYFLGEAAPVQKDAFNYLAEGTKGGVKTVATAIGEGLTAGMRAEGQPGLRCPRCQQANDADARFCKGCGTVLAR
jgi:hypothetical protein